MHKKILVFIIPFLSSAIFAQSNYSHYGLGETQSMSFSDNLSMSNSFYVNNDSLSVNLLNPASLSGLKYTAYNIGVRTTFTSISTSKSSGYSEAFNFQNFAIGLPIIAGKWGMSYGLMPYSVIANETYAISSNPFIGRIATNYKNSGGISKLFLANGFAIKNFSFGLSASFLFGDITNQVTSNFLDDNLYSSQQVNKNYFRGMGLDYGIQYLKVISENRVYGVGATISTTPIMKLNSNFLNTLYLDSYNLIFDTLSNISSKSTIAVPVKLAIGGFYQLNEKVKLAGSFTTQNWSGYNFGVSANSLKNNNVYAGGFEYLPLSKNYKSFFNDIKYRVGIRYSDGYVKINNVAINDYGITFGLGVPVRRTGTRINVGCELGRRGTTEKGLFLENYTNIYFGFTFNDKWFNKIKYD